MIFRSETTFVHAHEVISPSTVTIRSSRQLVLEFHMTERDKLGLLPPSMPQHQLKQTLAPVGAQLLLRPVLVRKWLYYFTKIAVTPRIKVAQAMRWLAFLSAPTVI